MIPEPEDHVAAAGAGHLRASHADREHAIDRLKVAFVQGRLAKDELDARVSRAFASRTYAELARVTADLPAGPAWDRPPRQHAREQARPPVSRAATVTRLGVVLAAAIMAVAIFAPVGPALFLFTPLFYTALMVAVAQIPGSQHAGRSRRQLPGPPAPGAGR